MEDLKNKKFGKLIVEEYAGRKKPGVNLWKCKCDCGNEVVVRASDLKSGNTKSCGCSRKFREDLTGKQFNFLTVIEYAGREKGKGSLWLCECECGNRKIISKKALKSGIKGCGCILSSTKSGYKRKSERLYAIYNGIKERCLNKNNENYDLYGGRGISICDEWMRDNGYANFRTWALNNGYKNELTIDRIDVNGNYEPSNCRWATMKTQMNNRRNSIKININGQEMTLSDIADEYGISRGTVGSRYRAGCVGDEIIFGKDLKKYEVDGRLYTADEISNVFGIPKRQFASRLGKGWSVERAATFPYKSFVEKEIEYNGEKHTINEWSEITGIKHQTLRWR